MNELAVCDWIGCVCPDGLQANAMVAEQKVSLGCSVHPETFVRLLHGNNSTPQQFELLLNVVNRRGC
jgi:hypothetical protein